MWLLILNLITMLNMIKYYTNNYAQNYEKVSYLQKKMEILFMHNYSFNKLPAYSYFFEIKQFLFFAISLAQLNDSIMLFGFAINLREMS